MRRRILTPGEEAPSPDVYLNVSHDNPEEIIWVGTNFDISSNTTWIVE